MKLVFVAFFVAVWLSACASASAVLRQPQVNAVVFEDDQPATPADDEVEVCLLKASVLHCVLWETFEGLVKQNRLEVPNKDISHQTRR